MFNSLDNDEVLQAIIRAKIVDSKNQYSSYKEYAEKMIKLYSQIHEKNPLIGHDKTVNEFQAVVNKINALGDHDAGTERSVMKATYNCAAEEFVTKEPGSDHNNLPKSANYYLDPTDSSVGRFVMNILEEEDRYPHSSSNFGYSSYANPISNPDNSRVGVLGEEGFRYFSHMMLDASPEKMGGY